MPIYEYECQFCHNRFEKIQAFSDDPLTNCPDCGKAGLKKCVSMPNFQLKGTGWYETDFKKQSKLGTKEVENQTKIADNKKADVSKPKEKSDDKD